MRGRTEEGMLQKAYGKEKVDIPRVPGLGLLLENVCEFLILHIKPLLNEVTQLVLSVAAEYRRIPPIRPPHA